MKFISRSFIFDSIRVLTGIVFILGAVLKLYPIAPLEILLVKINICNWFWAPIFARMLIGFEIVLGSLLLVKIYHKKILYLSLLTLIGFTIFLFYFKFILGKDDNCGCFGEAIHLNPIESVIKNIALMILIIYSIINAGSEFSWMLKYRKLILSSIIVAGFSVPFMLNAVTFPGGEGNYVIKPGMNITADKFSNVRFNGDSINLLSGRKLICFLSLQCKTCKYTATKLAILNKKHGNALPIYIIFLEVEDNEKFLIRFMKETEADNIPNTTMKSEQFFRVSDGKLPFLMYLDNGQIKNLSNFDDMNPDALIDFFEGR